jgi:hypothetical protein
MKLGYHITRSPIANCWLPGSGVIDRATSRCVVGAGLRIWRTCQFKLHRALPTILPVLRAHAQFTKTDPLPVSMLSLFSASCSIDKTWVNSIYTVRWKRQVHHRTRKLVMISWARERFATELVGSLVLGFDEMRIVRSAHFIWNYPLLAWEKL